MAFSTAKFTELPLRSYSPLSSIKNRSFFSSSSSLHSSPSPLHTQWLPKWTPHRSTGGSSSSAATRSATRAASQTGAVSREQPPYPKGKGDKTQNAIERIVLRLRDLGLVEEAEEAGEGELEKAVGKAGNFNKDKPLTGEEKLGELLKREWVRPDTVLRGGEGIDEEDGGDGSVLLPWEREGKRGEERERREGHEGRRVVVERRVARAPTLAELTIGDEQLRRLRRDGMLIRDRVSIPKAGLTREVMERIHDKWRKEELVRLKFHEVLAKDMKTAHEIVERRTGGLVVWRAGSVMVVFRGLNYQGPLKSGKDIDDEGNAPFVPDVSLGNVSNLRAVERGTSDTATSTIKKSVTTGRREVPVEDMTEEEIEYNSLLDGLGPRFEEWWGTGVLPVDADLLPQKVPDYKTPFRLLPTGMRSRLTNAEMTSMRKIAKSLPCHFALGRNRNHQGLAAAILKLWEKSLIAKIAIKRGIQNTNNKIMAEELKVLTEGVLLLRNKYYIVIYRGKDFLPTSVAAVLAERNEQAKHIQDMEDRVRDRVGVAISSQDEGKPLAGTLAEFYEAQARWGKDVSAEEREKIIEEASKAKHARLVRKVERKIEIAQAKKHRAERLLSKIEASMVTAGPDYDQETITEEERAMFRRVGLRMKPYLPLGIRGVFDGVVENMHLHWKHRELVKLISKQKTLEFVEDTARLLEYESGGILVAIERVPKGFALIYYRGKNYRRPIKIRPRNLLTKAKALKRSVAMQRHEALGQHINELERTIDQMMKDIGRAEEDDDNLMSQEEDLLKHTSTMTQSDKVKEYYKEDDDDEEEDDEDYNEEQEDEDDYEEEEHESDDDDDDDPGVEEDDIEKYFGGDASNGIP